MQIIQNDPRFYKKLSNLYYLTGGCSLLILNLNFSFKVGLKFGFISIKEENQTKHSYVSYKSCRQKSEIKHFSAINLESVKRDGGRISINTAQSCSRMDIKNKTKNLPTYRII